MKARFWRNPRWWRQLAGTSAGLWSATVLSFLGTLLAARGLGVHGYGQMVLAASAVLVLATFLDLPLEEAIVFHGQKHLSNGDYESARAAVRIGITLDFLMGAILLAVVWVLAEPIAAAVSRPPLDPFLLRLTALGVLFKTIDGTTGALLLLAQRPALRAISDATEAGVRLLLVGLAAGTGNVITVMAAHTAASLIGSLFQAVLVVQVSTNLWRGRAARVSYAMVARDLLRFGIHTGMANVVFSARSSFAPLILGRLAGPAATGILDVAHLPLKAAGIMTAPARLAMYPEQASLWASGQPEALRDSVKAATRAGLVAGVPGVIVGWIALPLVLEILYSGQFAEALRPARVLLLAALVHLTLAWSKSLPAATGRPQLRTIVALVEMVAIAIGVAALGDHGPLGAALAITAATVLGGCVWLAVAESPLRRSALPEHPS